MKLSTGKKKMWAGASILAAGALVLAGCGGGGAGSSAKPDEGAATESGDESTSAEGECSTDITVGVAMPTATPLRTAWRRPGTPSTCSLLTMTSPPRLSRLTR